MNDTANRHQQPLSAKRKPIPVGIVIAAGFAVFIGACLLMAYVRAQFPSQLSVCTKQCLAQGKVGEMAYVHSAAMTAGMQGPGAQKCKCQ